MSISNQTVTIVDSNGTSTVVTAGSTASTTGTQVMGMDGTNARILLTDNSGRLIISGQGLSGTPAGGVISIQGVTGGTPLPVSGTVTVVNASVSTIGSAVPSSATFIGGTDGSNLIALRIKAASTAAVATDPSLVIAFSPNSPLPTGANVIGAVTQSGGPWTNIVTQTTASNLNALVVQGAAGTASTGWFSKITDGTNIASVKAASTAAIATDSAMVVAISPNNTIGTNITQIGGFNVSSNLGLVPVDLSQVETVFKHLIVSSRLPQIQIAFDFLSPALLLTSTLTGTGLVSGPTAGAGAFGTGTGTTGRSLGTTFTTVAYSPHEELFATWTNTFTIGTSGTYQRIGIYNSSDGFSFGYNGTVFGVWSRFNSVDTFISQASWNTDTLSGISTSKFTRGGTPESLIQTNLNLYRIRFGCLGVTSVIFEVLSADGNFVTVHTLRHPNSQTGVSITNPYLPITIDVNNNSVGTTNLLISCGCWAAGTSTSTSVAGGLVAPILTVNTNGNVGPASAGSSVSAPTASIGVVGIGISGTWVGTIAFQYSMDGNLWFSDTVFNAATGSFIVSTTSNGNFEAPVGPFRQYRVVASAWTSGVAIIAANGGASPTFLNTLSAITDGASNGPAAVKAGSTAAVISDSSLVVSLSPNSPVKATVKPLYGANNQALTITLASLATNTARASTVVDNTTNLFEDALIFVKLTSAAAATLATGYANVFVYATVDNGTTYSENATGVDAAITLVSPTNLILIAQVNVVANAITYRAGPFSICRSAGWDRLPAKWGIVIQNQSGATLNATASNHAVTYQGVNGQLI